ncbi:unnamed protein product [Prunus armeniaca]
MVFGTFLSVSELGWVQVGFSIKRHFDGSIERYKARLVAKGFHKRPSIDYAKTFSPLVKPATIRIVLSLVVSHSWSPHQLDVKNAFLHGFLQEDVYMAQPPSGHFDIKDLGPLNYFLGLQVLHKDGTLHINQLKYAHDLLQKANLLNSKPASTPLAAKVLLSVSDGAIISNPTEYCELIGSLQYLTFTRLDISFAINIVAQFMSAPRASHLVAAKRILRYIKGTIDLGLTFTPQTAAARLSAYSDADWAGCLNSRRSTTGYVITLETNLISWCSKKQPTVSRSSTESEYRTLSHACVETTWLCSFLHELGVRLRFPVQLFRDNLSTTYMATNPIFHAHTRHIELDYHFVREKVALGSHQVCLVPFVDQPVDLFTKAPHKPRHHHMSSKLVHPVKPSLPGGGVLTQLFFPRLHGSQLYNILLAISLSCCKSDFLL